MKKAIVALLLLIGAFAFAQDSDDFFSDSNDSVLEKARQKYDERQSAEDESEEYESDEDKRRAIDLVREKDDDGSDAREYPDEDDDAIIGGDRGSEGLEFEEDEEALAFEEEDQGDDGAYEAEDSPPDRYRVKREMIINLFGIELSFSIEPEPRDAKPARKASPAREQPEQGAKSDSGAAAKSARAAERKAEPPEASEEAPFSPIVISILPGISIPFGTYRTNLSLAAIGGITSQVSGIAASGVFDIVEGDLLGIQSAGIFSVVGGKAVGIQGSGVFNVASRNMSGLQASGVFNVVGDDLLGIQSAGVFNMARDVAGGQFAGVFNTARQVRGIQAAGVFNVANDVRGAQAAGVVNVANEVRGTQIGLVNISQDMYGIPIGLFNFTLNGVRDIGFWQDTSKTVYAFWANGTNDFYTILYAGEAQGDWFRDTDTLAVGYGLGARLTQKALKLDIDVSAKHYYGPRLAQMVAAWRESAAGGYYVPWAVSPVFPSLRLTLGVPVLKKLELFGGISADIGIAGACALPAEIMGPNGFSFRAFDRQVDVNPQFYWGLRI